jgi:hypothetical protein
MGELDASLAPRLLDSLGQRGQRRYELGIGEVVHPGAFHNDQGAAAHGSFGIIGPRSFGGDIVSGSHWWEYDTVF